MRLLRVALERDVSGSKAFSSELDEDMLHANIQIAVLCITLVLATSSQSLTVSQRSSQQ